MWVRRKPRSIKVRSEIAKRRANEASDQSARDTESNRNPSHLGNCHIEKILTPNEEDNGGDRPAGILQPGRSGGSWPVPEPSEYDAVRYSFAPKTLTEW